MTEQLTVMIGDAYSLPREHDWFDLVVVIGWLAWLRDPNRALWLRARMDRLELLRSVPRITLRPTSP